MPTNSNNIIIDSNLLIDYYILAEKEEKLQRLLPFIKKGVWINDVTVGEVTNFLKNKVNYYSAFLAMHELLHYPFYNVLAIEARTRAVAGEILKQYKDLELAYNDCLLLAQSSLLNIPILTEDAAMWQVKEASFVYL